MLEEWKRWQECIKEEKTYKKCKVYFRIYLETKQECKPSRR